MAKSKAELSEINVRQISSLVKKDIASLQAHADRLTSFLKSPGAVALRICECCINVSKPDPGTEPQRIRSARRK
ncbi:hypothetical protein [Candidatus Methylomirabilis sp.]|uniref:hypothetical protein n=1 Tax=Candidatus Methylomirabilis sp. TaxID=2032687 RepID=UPI002A619F55|nr:hypothetical protein [Candidatus Methylomirabilis sp.]